MEMNKAQLIKFLPQGLNSGLKQSTRSSVTLHHTTIESGPSIRCSFVLQIAKLVHLKIDSPTRLFFIAIGGIDPIIKHLIKVTSS